MAPVASARERADLSCDYALSPPNYRGACPVISIPWWSPQKTLIFTLFFLYPSFFLLLLFFLLGRIGVITQKHLHVRAEIESLKSCFFIQSDNLCFESVHLDHFHFKFNYIIWQLLPSWLVFVPLSTFLHWGWGGLSNFSISFYLLNRLVISCTSSCFLRFMENLWYARTLTAVSLKRMHQFTYSERNINVFTSPWCDVFCAIIILHIISTNVRVSTKALSILP